PKISVPFEMWFDKTTHLPVQMIQAFGPAVAKRTFEDYRDVGGLKIPFKVEETDLDGNVSTIDLNGVARASASCLSRPASSAQDFAIAGGRRETSVAMTLTDNHVYVPVMLNGKGPYRFIFDSGAENVVDPAVAEAVGAAGHGNFTGGGSGESAQDLTVATVKRVAVGDAVLSNQQFSVAPVRAGFG